MGHLRARLAFGSELRLLHGVEQRRLPRRAAPRPFDGRGVLLVFLVSTVTASALLEVLNSGFIPGLICQEGLTLKLWPGREWFLIGSGRRRVSLAVSCKMGQIRD